MDISEEPIDAPDDGWDREQRSKRGPRKRHAISEQGCDEDDGTHHYQRRGSAGLADRSDAGHHAGRVDDLRRRSCTDERGFVGDGCSLVLFANMIASFLPQAVEAGNVS